MALAKRFISAKANGIIPPPFQISQLKLTAINREQ